MMRASGILFISLNGNALFLKRSAKAKDCPGMWDFPGGGQEGDETAEQTAMREAREEIGFVPDGTRVLHTRTRSAPAPGAGGLGAPSILPVSVGAPMAPSPSAVDAVDFTTFLQKVTNEFTPELDYEHDGWAWSPLGSPPETIHPGCRVALDRLGMDELGVARAIADGRLTSPQTYENMMLWAIRITGTDTAFRSKHGEFVHRSAEHYLNDEFLARCNGLPVLLKHPTKAILDSKEFANRVVGTIFLPYIASDEVWGIAKIYDDDANRQMGETYLSTSPGVNFKDFSVNAKLTFEDGSKVLIEGKPSLFDHVAICELGVWDKGGEPTGIRSESREDAAMTPEEQAKKDADEAEAKKKADAAKKDETEDTEEEKKKKAEAKAKADADAGTELDKKLSAIGDAVGKVADAVGKMGGRMDAFEASEKVRKDAEDKAKADAEEEERKKGDPERLKADKAKKDAEEEADKKKKADAEKEEKEKAKADSDSIRKRIDEVAGMIPKSMGDADYSAMTDAQARADDVFAKFGLSAPRPLDGETPRLYERRVIRTLKDHSPTWKGLDLTNPTAFADDVSFNNLREQVYAEASKTALSPVTVPGGQLRMITKKSGGHEIHEWVGEPRTWMDPMAGASRQFVTGIKTPTNN